MTTTISEGVVVNLILAVGVAFGLGWCIFCGYQSLCKNPCWRKEASPPEPKPKPRRYPAFGATKECPKCGADVADVTRRHMESWDDDGKLVECMTFHCPQCGAHLGEWPKDHRETPEEAAQREVDEAAP